MTGPSRVSSQDDRRRNVIFPIDILDALAPHARKRGIHVSRIARLIVELVLDDGLVDAVLDDADVDYRMPVVGRIRRAA